MDQRLWGSQFVTLWVYYLGIEIVRRKSRRGKLRQTLARLDELIAEYQVESIVLGFPKNMNNTIGDRAEKSLALKCLRREQVCLL